ncbi:MAG: hypothetical protein J6Q53_04180 [Oscillospiraceae bacterium]|nr:hypothetical protein [Oscillospiraceae bacterium]
MAIDGVKITIEEWAGDNGISLTDEQIVELAEAIDTAYEMSMPCGYGIDRYRHEENIEIKRLKNQIDMLQRYLDSKGLHCILYDDKVVRPYWVNIGDRSCNVEEIFR